MENGEYNHFERSRFELGSEFAKRVCLFTHRKFDIFDARFALDVATPMEFALATFLDLGPDRFVAAVAAHCFAPIRAIRVFLANPAVGSKRSDGVVDVTVVGRSIQKHQVVGGRNVADLPANPETSRSSGLDSCRIAVLVCQVIPNLSEGRQLLPARN